MMWPNAAGEQDQPLKGAFSLTCLINSPASLLRVIEHMAMKSHTDFDLPRVFFSKCARVFPCANAFCKQCSVQDASLDRAYF
ncbi:hypothetical protein CHR56_37400 (plasmid) [Rhizobium leguminosarum bv. viciae]|nr:hypothetical protein CHR56_37400 [Rhizobium leguminosarum bv. viciae]